MVTVFANGRRRSGLAVERCRLIQRCIGIRAQKLPDHYAAAIARGGRDCNGSRTGLRILRVPNIVPVRFVRVDRSRRTGFHVGIARVIRHAADRVCHVPAVGLPGDD